MHDQLGSFHDAVITGVTERGLYAEIVENKIEGMIAMRDLDIRGAGNLLGDSQSGHIKEVGVELYQRMLEEAVAAGLDDIIMITGCGKWAIEDYFDITTELEANLNATGKHDFTKRYTMLRVWHLLLMCERKRLRV